MSIFLMSRSFVFCLWLLCICFKFFWSCLIHCKWLAAFLTPYPNLVPQGSVPIREVSLPFLHEDFTKELKSRAPSPSDAASLNVNSLQKPGNRQGGKNCLQH